MKDKISLLAVVFVVLPLFVFANGTKETQGTQSSTKPTLTVMTWKASEDPGVVLPIMKDFGNKYNVTVNSEAYGYEQMQTKVVTLAQANALPDVVQLTSDATMPILAELGTLVNLDPYIQKAGGQQFLAQFAPASLGAAKYKGHYYVLPEYVYNIQILYNPKLFAKAGVKPPTNWNELEADAKKLTDQSAGVYGLAIPGQDFETLLNFANLIAENGGSVGLPEKLGRVPSEPVQLSDIGINKPKSVQAITFGINLLKSIGVPFLGVDYKKVREMLARGQAAMIFDGTHTAAFLTSNYHPDFTITGAQMPVGPLGKPAATLSAGDTTLAISASSKEKDLAFKYISYINSDAVMTKYAVAVKSTSANLAGLDAVAKACPLCVPSVDQIEGKAPQWYHMPLYNALPPQLGTAIDDFNTGVQRAFSGQASVQQAMDEVANQWKSLWTEWQNKYK